MSEPTDSRETELNRRDVLKRGAVATGALVVGGTAVSGSATAQPNGMGGSGFVTDAALGNIQSAPDEEFQITGPDSDYPTLTQSPSCSGNNPNTKTYDGYVIEDSNGDDLGTLFVEPNRNVNTGVWLTLRNVQSCGEGDVENIPTPEPTNKVSFGPA